MDLYCPRCGEPWEIDSLHEEAQRRSDHIPELAGVEYSVIFDRVRNDFQIRGCAVVEGKPLVTCEKRTGNEPGAGRALAAGALYDLLGDDIDGAASMLDDLGPFGLDF